MNAGVYCRISQDRDGRGQGVARQEADCRALCERRGWDVAQVYVDNDVSASTGRARPEYERMLDDVKNGMIGAVVAYHNDRLHRSPRELEDFIDIIDTAGAQVATVSGGEYDLSTATGRMGARIVGAVARAESDRLRERIRRKHLELAQDGKVSGGGTRPYGFLDVRTIDEAEAAHVREAARRIIDGEALRSIVVDWNRSGVATVTGRPWATFTLRRLLISARIAGKREHHGVITDAEWPAIVDDVTWSRLRSILTDPARRVNSNPRSYLLTGLAVCGLCGARLVARPKADKRRCYVCATGPGFHGCGKIRRLADDLEGYVVDRMFPRIDAHLTAPPPDETALALLLATVDDLRARLDNLTTDYYVEQAVGREQYLGASQRLRSHLEAAQRAVQAESRAPAAIPIVDRDTWDDEPFATRRAVVQGYVEQVTVGPAVRGRNYFDSSCIHIDWK